MTEKQQKWLEFSISFLVLALCGGAMLALQSLLAPWSLVLIMALSASGVICLLMPAWRRGWQAPPASVEAEAQEAAATTAQQISVLTSKIAIGAAEVSHFIDGLNASIDTNGEYTSQIAVAAEELSQTTGQLSDNAAHILHQAQAAESISIAGRQQAQTGVGAIQSLSRDIDNAAQRVHSLKTQAEGIQKITEVINSVAEQTNLLALNAAIEAARAGEQGRGFAVVADEVRSLASKTAGATRDIAGMLSSMHTETDRTSALMEQVVGQTADAVSAMELLDARFTEIASSVVQSANALAEMEEALKEYTSTTNDISGAISQIRDSLALTGEESQSVSKQAFNLSLTTEGIFTALTLWDTQTLDQRVLQLAQAAAEQCGLVLEQGLAQGVFSEQQLFQPQYQQIANTQPPKFSTGFDAYTDQHFPSLQEPLLAREAAISYAGAVDKRGYFPTHNQRYAKPLTGKPEIDIIHNRTKRLFNDPTGIRCGQHRDKVLLQTYKRDTGEVMHDLSVPIYVRGRHWGGFRVGFKAA
ncbi:methyl-accepting chemotaxis protein [Shewanella salipaludis]|uniref:Methyl-accepting chemotaxis protein n=1 Tax=Shewanella salipaludis TaxID=2723052 RepID=A0A972G1J1_9GAMM|nr:methyl-accepting chemotaxis protein [Shewanella salipaludis]NMH65821.1 methyl-accepting chemotaxis protein [Shewanella salipaludis]